MEPGCQTPLISTDITIENDFPFKIKATTNHPTGLTTSYCLQCRATSPDGTETINYNEEITTVVSSLDCS